MADTSLDVFKQKFTSVRPTLFTVEFNFSEDSLFLKNKWLKSDKIRDIYIYCKETKLPQSTLEYLTVTYLGRSFFEGTDKTYEPLELTFYNSQDFAIRNFIEFWMNNINDKKDLSQANKTDDKKKKYDQFMDSIIITQMDRRNNPIKKYEFMGAFPINLGEIALDYNQNNSIEEFNATFRYQWFETKEFSGGNN